MPYRFSISEIILGTITAGDTAPTTVPIIAASNTETPSIGGANITIPTSSNATGKKHINTAGLPTFFRTEISSVNPALIRIIIRAIFLISADMLKTEASIKFSVYGPRTTPAAIIPTRGGRCILAQHFPDKSQINKISEILNSIKNPHTNAKADGFCVKIAEAISLKKRF